MLQSRASGLSHSNRLLNMVSDTTWIHTHFNLQTAKASQMTWSCPRTGSTEHNSKNSPCILIKTIVSCHCSLETNQYKFADQAPILAGDCVTVTVQPRAVTTFLICFVTKNATQRPGFGWRFLYLGHRRNGPGSAVLGEGRAGATNEFGRKRKQPKPTKRFQKDNQRLGRAENPALLKYRPTRVGPA